MRWFSFLFFTLCSLTDIYAQRSPDPGKEARLLTRILQEQHLQPRAINDKFSADVFKVFLETIDPDKLIFSEADLKSLVKYKTLLDDELNGDGWNFLNEIIPLYQKCLLNTEEIVIKQTNAPLVSTTNEYLEYDTTHWAYDEPERIVRWKRWLKYQILDRLTDRQKGYNESDADLFARYEPEVRLRVKSYELRSIKRVLNHPSGFDAYITAAYFQCIASVFDPHTTYMPITGMENFLSSLSTEGYYFGVTLDENERGDVFITALAPGGSAWKSGELQTSDVLINLTWEGQEPIDVTGISLEEANEILADNNHQSMKFTVRKPSGLTTSVTLRKEKISLEENYARSYLLKDKYTIGYISLPDFYTQWGDDSEGTHCAEDVAKEIIKLKKENIDGLIIDVRYNGGGSLQEAAAMAGIFIDEGPLGFLKGKDPNAIILKDMTRGTIYDGPLILMVNGQSASASEFLAAVLQDYNRAVIVGSRTFGKATAQNFFPLDSAQGAPSLQTLQGQGYASITTDKIYRVTGKAVQGKGIRPDVLLPDMLDALMIRESDLPFALPNDSLPRKASYRPLSALPLRTIKRNSETRIRSTESFQHVVKSLQWLTDELKKKNQPLLLSWEFFSKENKDHEARYAALEKLLDQRAGNYEVINSSLDQQRMVVDDYSNKFNATWIRNLRKDIYLAEAFRVMTDLIEIKHK
ncbi:carboxy terminal-processing peptidase [Ohtaekwangia koreensis]|uniref:Carboxyl-terminal processing protease n=1 Tax=Ohtaekwangia koreensis TaxID=688867 RepID=A0A1T5J5Z1_9BACT|nr:carboxy terminal-processing peptidase [Ohtaekwangia koreensis]SKC46678.1 carboxyl-terminal processing protease [Ohtaekwangia koreensis]